jgi:NADPH:quinone reductase-like Zn-dependent oxidoreductase
MLPTVLILPVAGLTALRAVEEGGLLIHKRVLITGSTGGVISWSGKAVPMLSALLAMLGTGGGSR